MPQHPHWLWVKTQETPGEHLKNRWQTHVHPRQKGIAIGYATHGHLNDDLSFGKEGLCTSREGLEHLCHWFLASRIQPGFPNFPHAATQGVLSPPEIGQNNSRPGP